MKICYRLLVPVFFLLILSGCAGENFFAKTPIADSAIHEKLVTSAAPFDSVVVQAGKHYNRSKFHNVFWGKHYRPVWTASVKVPVFNMDTTKGGLTVEKIGGGFQTTSITLADKSGKKYALRTLDKDPATVLPKALRKTFLLNVLRDQTSAANPYGALVVAPLAAAAGILHATPELVYVRPHDSSFGEHEALFSDKLFILENKYKSDKDATPDMGNVTDFNDSETVLRQRFERNDVVIDDLSFAKARLLDLLINDWDRHEGQWDWALYKDASKRLYRPIPKDRDNAFFQFQDGLFPWLFSRNWGIRKFESFHEDITDVKALMINAAFIDQRVMAQLTRQQIDSLARVLQASLTDAVIEQSVQQLPNPVFSLIGSEMIAKLKNRRAQLPEVANEFYEILAKKPLVIGTDKTERFVVKRLNDEHTEVTVYRESDAVILYHRIFNRSETKLISLYGLAGNDEFDVSGKVGKGIKIKIIGGLGEDEITDKSDVAGWGNKTWVYDTKRGTELKAGPTTKDKRTSDVRVHAFDREGY